MKFLPRISAIILLLGATLLYGCSVLVDEDLSDCGGEISIIYQLRLITNMQTELETVLCDKSDEYVKEALQQNLEGIFSDIGRDVDLAFYSPEGDMPRKIHIKEVFNANQARYVVYFPEREYMHTCVANMEGNGPVALRDTLHCNSSRLMLDTSQGEVPNQQTGIYTARNHILIGEEDNQTIYTYLYMANCATALVLDTGNAGEIGPVEVATNGFADRFDIVDSTYLYNSKYIVQPRQLPVEQGSEQCFLSVNFPSRDVAPTKAWGDDFIWQWRVRVPIADGTITETVLGVKEPLMAGQLKIIKAKVYDTGVVSVTDPLVGVSVTIDWHTGDEHEIEF